MDLEKLRQDWENDPQLKYLAYDTVEELAAHLKKCHQMMMMNGELGCLGYLYKQQTLRVRELTQEIKHDRERE